MIDQSPSQLRGNAPAFQPTAYHINTSAPNPSSLRGNAPTFHTKAIKWQQKRRQSTSIIPTQPQSAFLSRLPGELRNLIYELALTEPTPIPAVRSARMPGQHEYAYKCKYKYKFNTPALGQVCRQIRQECLGIAYSNNTFIFKLLAGQYCIPKTLINGWVKRLARAGVDKCVKRVGCEWTSQVLRKSTCRVVTVHWSVTATLGEDVSTEEKLAKRQWEMQLNRKQRRKLKHQRQRGPYAVLLGGDSAPGTARPKVVFEVDPPIKGLCEHVLDAYARAFEGRREGKSVRGYGALIDVVMTVCNFLRPEESEVWPIKVCR